VLVLVRTALADSRMSVVYFPWLIPWTCVCNSNHPAAVRHGSGRHPGRWRDL